MLSWSLIVTTESLYGQNMEYSHSSRSPHVVHEWGADASIVHRFPQGFHLCFHVDDWVMFQTDESDSLDSNIRLRLVARFQGESSVRSITVEDLCPFNFPKRRSPGCRTVNAWNDGGSVEFIGLGRERQKKMVVFSMHFMRLIASMPSVTPFARLLPMPHMTEKFFGNVQNESAKLRLRVDPHKAPPKELWVHLDLQDCHGIKVGQSQAAHLSLNYKAFVFILFYAIFEECVCKPITC